MSSHNIDRKATAILNRMVAGRELSATGRDWLIAAMDPFHDSEIELDGYPDMVSSRSITQCVQKTVTVSAPSGTTGNWDCHMFFIPGVDLFDEKLWGNDIFQNGRVAAPAVGRLNHLVGGLNVISCAPGLEWSATSNTLIRDLRIPKAYSRRKHRLVGVGYEVRNVTAELYKQGTVVCYKQPMQWSEIALTGSATPSDGPWKFGYSTAVPPKTSASAALYPNSRIWDAKEGVYAILTLNDVENKVLAPGPTLISVNDVDFSTSPAVATPQGNFGTYPSDMSGAVRYPFDNVGAIFSGLSKETSLQVTVRYLYERFPDEDDPDLLVLARPPSSYDPLALELYARCLKELPSYVMVKDNPLGEWFSKILSVVSDVAPVIGKVIPIPGASMIGDLVGKGAGAVSSVLRTSPAAASSAASSSAGSIKPKKKKHK